MHKMKCWACGRPAIGAIVRANSVHHCCDDHLPAESGKTFEVVPWPLAAAAVKAVTR